MSPGTSRFVLPKGDETPEERFAEAIPPMSDAQALQEASRCLFCFDAPCIRACPTGIDVPTFIRKILSGNREGSAQTIFDDNPLGGTCARVCPVEALCEGACVRNDLDETIQIGRLQRYATDCVTGSGEKLFEKIYRRKAAASKNGRKVAVVGAGPAGLACAVGLAERGFTVTVYEKSPRPGGLAEYGIVPYRLPREIPRVEADAVARMGVTFVYGKAVGADVPAEKLLAENDAVFLGMGVQKAKEIGVPGEGLPGVVDALAFLAEVCTGNRAAMKVPKSVVVVGCGNTAMDAACSSAKLGVGEVHVVYRRNETDATAYPSERALAKSLGVRFHWRTMPTLVFEHPFLKGRAGGVEVVDAHVANLGKGKTELQPVAGTERRIAADRVIRAVGQALPTDVLTAFGVAHQNGRVPVDPETFRTNVPKVFAGGDMVNGAKEAVHAVQEGKLAAAGIAKVLLKAPGGR